MIISDSVVCFTIYIKYIAVNLEKNRHLID